MADPQTIKELKEKIAKKQAVIKREEKREALEVEAIRLKRQLKSLQGTPESRARDRRKVAVKTEFKRIIKSGVKAVSKQAKLIKAKQDADDKRFRNSSGQFAKKQSKSSKSKKTKSRKSRSQPKRQSSGEFDIFGGLDF